MLQFNPQNGTVKLGNETVHDSAILSLLTYEITLKPGTEENFSLSSIKMLLKKYPSLQALSDRSKRFLSRMSETSDSPSARDPSINALVLRRYTSVTESELTVKSTEISCQKSQNSSLVCASITANYDQAPSVNVSTGIYLSGKDSAGPDLDKSADYSLLGLELDSLKSLPIYVGAEEILVTKEFASANRDDIDHTRTKQNRHYGRQSAISLLEMLDTVLLELGL